MFGLAQIKRMNAEECRRRAEMTRKIKPSVKHLIDRVDSAIERASLKGEIRIDENPLAGLRCPISKAEMDEVWDNLRGRGFKVTIRGKRFSILW